VPFQGRRFGVDTYRPVVVSASEITKKIGFALLRVSIILENRFILLPVGFTRDPKKKENVAKNSLGTRNCFVMGSRTLFLGATEPLG